MFCYKTNTSKDCRVRPKFVGHDSAWSEALLFEQLLHQFLGGFGVASALDEEVQFAFIVHGTPEPVAPSANDKHHFIEGWCQTKVTEQSNFPCCKSKSLVWRSTLGASRTWISSPATHAAIYNTFNVQRHLITHKAMRQFRSEAMNTWRNVTAAA